MLEVDIVKTLHGAIGEMQLNVNFTLKKNQFLALTGKSGSGKTTLLRIIAGLEVADKGILKVDEKYWLNSSTNIHKKIQERDIGFVFQDYALFPNMSVYENLLFAKNDKKQADTLLDMVDLKELKNRYPNSLSGGQKQRVALIRSLMKKPKILLLDEPLSALDPVIREKLQKELVFFHKEFDMTTIIVSHDPSEIYSMANRVFVLENGKIIKDGSPKKILLKMKGSQKFSFTGQILEINKIDALFIGVVAIGNQIVEVVLDTHEAINLQKGDMVNIGTKAFSPIVSKLK